MQGCGNRAMSGAHFTTIVVAVLQNIVCASVSRQISGSSKTDMSRQDLLSPLSAESSFNFRAGASDSLRIPSPALRLLQGDSTFGTGNWHRGAICKFLRRI